MPSLCVRVCAEPTPALLPRWSCRSHARPTARAAPGVWWPRSARPACAGGASQRAHTNQNVAGNVRAPLRFLAEQPARGRAGLASVPPCRPLHWEPARGSAARLARSKGVNRRAQKAWAERMPSPSYEARRRAVVAGGPRHGERRQVCARADGILPAVRCLFPRCLSPCRCSLSLLRLSRLSRLDVDQLALWRQRRAGSAAASLRRHPLADAPPRPAGRRPRAPSRAGWRRLGGGPRACSR